MMWEKTVEYAFVARVVRNNLADFGAPLAGTHEIAGDAIFGHLSGLLLIEFKAEESKLDSEMKKFVRYEQAEELLKGSDEHHLLVYGETSTNGFDLKARRYFARHPVNISESLPLGLPPKPFSKYLLQLLALRKRHKRGSGAIALSDYATVLGLNTSNKIVHVISLKAYARALFPHLMQAQQLPSEPKPVPRPGFKR
ncbi:MAG: hypothetical protein A3E01_18740 [Gammaproteobacteria bacterium RIFCSPHIGHO2_12_FULL_63_22]|nr:MAG: hypothetical protein A3E01_18740 [Gammaproteobacteria bacterium RIFCSPHIGHO2_12_FULL_63_22]